MCQAGTILSTWKNTIFIESSVCGRTFSTNCFHLFNTYYVLSPALLPATVKCLSYVSEQNRNHYTVIVFSANSVPDAML